MIVTQTPPPGKYWSREQMDWYISCLKDKKCTLAYYLTTKDNLPLHSPNKKGWKASPGLMQSVLPDIYRGIVPCSQNALHASLDISPWLKMDCKIWVVGMYEAIDADDKICSLNRKIIGSYDPKELTDELQLITYPKFNLNQKNKLFKNIVIKNGGINDVSYKLENIDFTDSDFRDCELWNIQFKNCNLTDVTFSKCEFESCKFINCKIDRTYVYEDCKFYHHEIVGKIKELTWYAKTIPEGFEIKKDSFGLLVRSKKGKKNV